MGHQGRENSIANMRYYFGAASASTCPYQNKERHPSLRPQNKGSQRPEERACKNREKNQKQMTRRFTAEYRTVPYSTVQYSTVEYRRVGMDGGGGKGR